VHLFLKVMPTSRNGERDWNSKPTLVKVLNRTSQTGIIRKLGNGLQELESLAKQGKVEGFFSNVENADKLGGLVEDIRDAMMEYQVCIHNCPSPALLMLAPDFVAARSLRQEFPTHRKSRSSPSILMD